MRLFGNQVLGPDLGQHFAQAGEVFVELPQPERRIESRRNAAGKLHAQQRIEELDRCRQDQGHAIAALESARLQCRGGLLRAAQHILVRIKRGFLVGRHETRAPARAGLQVQQNFGQRGAFERQSTHACGSCSQTRPAIIFTRSWTVSSCCHCSNPKAQPKSCSMVVTSTTCASESSCRASISETLGPIACDLFRRQVELFAGDLLQVLQNRFFIPFD